MTLLMRYRLLASIAGLILIGLILGSFFLRVWPFGKSKGNVPELALRHLVRDKPEGPLFTGPLLDDERFIEVLGTSKLQEIYDAKQKLCLVTISSRALARQKVFDVLPDGRINCATRGQNKLFFVEELFSGPGFPGEKLQTLTGKGPPETIFATRRATPYGDPQHIHSLSLCHSGKLLAFMVSGDNEWANWDNHSLKIYDFEKKTTTHIWSGDIGGPQGILSPYEWVQPLPWSPDDKKVLVSTSNGKILSIDVRTGTESKLCNGYLPIGFVDADRCLVLKRRAGWFSTSWRIIGIHLPTKKANPIIDITGPREVRAPLVAPGGDYISFVVRIRPYFGAKGVYLYSLVLRIDDFRYALFEAEVTAWTRE